MTEKEKRKHAEQEYAPYWMYGVFILIMLITAIFPLFHILDAYPHVHEYQAFARSTIRWMGFILCVVIVIAIYLESTSRRKYMLAFSMLVVAYATLFQDGIGLMIIGVLFSPITFITFPIFLVGLILMRITTRKVYTSEIVALIGLACLINMSIITGSWYMTNPYHAFSSKTIGDESYHLILDSGFLDPTHIKIYKCNNMGLLCTTIFRADEEYYFEDNLYWKVTEGENPSITIYVNDKAIHTETLNHPSD